MLLRTKGEDFVAAAKKEPCCEDMEPTDADKSKFSMFTYNATPASWRPLIDAARAQAAHLPCR